MDIGEIRARLTEIGNLEYSEHSKRYLKSPYSFYGIKVPLLREIARKCKNLGIYEAYNLFDDLWGSGNHEEMSLGIFILQNLKKEHNLETWKFLMKRIEKAKTWDHIDYLSTDILSGILLKNPQLASEIKEMASSRNSWIRRTAINSNYKLIKNKKLDLLFRLAEKLVYDGDVYVQKGAGWMLREAGKKDRIAVREFILMHMDMKNYAFSYATEKMPELRIKRKEMREKENAKND